MLAAFTNVRTFLLAIFLIMAGSGFLSTLIAIRLEREGTSTLAIGLVGTAYFAGLTIGSLRASRLIAEIGHVRSFAVFVSTFSASSLAYAIQQNVPYWMLLRFIDGFVVSGVYICLESWLNEQADHKSRSSVLAGYMVALYTGQALGQFLLTAGRDAPALPFMFSAILLSLAALPVLLTQVAQPRIEGMKAMSVKRLYDLSPLGVVGTVTTGVMLGAFYALGAVFVRQLGMSLAQVALFTSCAIAGGVVLQWPLGMLSDRFDRRRVIVACFAMAVAVCAVIAFNSAPGPHLFALGALFGGTAFALYPLCVAHSNDQLRTDERVSASGGLVLSYSAGAMVGPMVGSAGMAAFGPAGLYGAIGATALLTFVFGVWRLFAGDIVPSGDQQAFQTMARTTAISAQVQPDESET